jgi:hypothetical protein
MRKKIFGKQVAAALVQATALVWQLLLMLVLLWYQAKRATTL